MDSIIDDDESFDKYPGVDVVVTGGNDIKQPPPKKRLNDEKACKVPKLEKDAPEVVGYFTEDKPLDCEKREQNWVFINDEGQIEFSKERKTAECTIVYFKRLNDQYNVDRKGIKLVEGTRMKRDFAKVNCWHNWSEWSGLLLGAVADNKIVEQKKAILPPKDATGLNVLMLSFDSISHMTFLRKFPKTVNFAKTVLGLVIMEGHNIVGDGTPRAFTPILTGKTEVELPPVRSPEDNYVDDVYPFIWNNFSDSGYVTMFGEDSLSMGVYLYRMKGFRKAPTDHFPSTFFHEARKKKDRFCLGSEPTFKSWFRYAREFMHAYTSTPKFMILHQSMLSHDDLNQVGVEDEFLEETLRKMHKEGQFNNTLLILMTDHGSRFSRIRDTPQGLLEERLPFMSFAFPPKFLETPQGAKALANLKSNTQRLTTPFDLHATLMDVLHWPSDEQLATEQDINKRSLSMFRPIPEGRTCSQAGVGPHYCSCVTWNDAEIDEISTKLANVVIWAINKQLKDFFHLCATLSLKELISVKRIVQYVPQHSFMDYFRGQKEEFAYYQLKISTTPGRGVYEATLYYDFVKNFAHVDLDTLSHISRYGDDPHCILRGHYYLASFCVCHDRIAYGNETLI